MAENPLLPHRKLQELYALMGRCRALDARQGAGPAREAMLAAIGVQVEAGDVVSFAAEDRAAALIAPQAKNRPAGAQGFSASAARVLLAAATARGLQAAGNGVAVALLSAQAGEPGWREAFVWAQRERLPLVFVCTDTGGAARRRKADALSWSEAAKVARGVHLPTITVDGEDAVAMFRVMQEAILRGRTGGGPAVVWAMVSGSRTQLKAPAQPLARLRQYMRVRDIPMTS